MSFLRSLITDLRERQVLPAVALLLLLAIAIPVFAAIVLSKTGAAAPVAVTPVDTAPPRGTPPPASATLAASAAPGQTHKTYHGREQNPFRAYPASKTAGKSSSGSSTSTSSTPVATTTPTTTPTTTTTTTTKPKSAKPAPASLSSDEAYTVDVATGYGSETDKLGDLQRLSPLPENVNAEVVYLGVLKGGKMAVFLLTGAVAATGSLTGHSDCLPSATTCEVAELGVGAELTLTPTSADTSSVAPFTLLVSGIHAEQFSSAGGATAARESTSAAGQAIIAQSTTAELAAFFYDLQIGALVYSPISTGTTGASGTSSPVGSTGAVATGG